MARGGFGADVSSALLQDISLELDAAAREEIEVDTTLFSQLSFSTAVGESLMSGEIVGRDSEGFAGGGVNEEGVRGRGGGKISLEGGSVAATGNSFYSVAADRSRGNGRITGRRAHVDAQAEAEALLALNEEREKRTRQMGEGEGEGEGEGSDRTEEQEEEEEEEEEEGEGEEDEDEDEEGDKPSWLRAKLTVRGEKGTTVRFRGLGWMESIRERFL